MPFGRSIYCVAPSHDLLTVVSPIDAVMTAGIVVIGVAALFFLFLYQARPRYLVSVAVLVVLILVGAASHGRIVLDAVRGTAEVHTVFFGYPESYHYPLSAVMGASVASSQQSDALRLVFQGGSDLQLTPYNQMGGKGEAAYAINQFLQEHGGKGTPN